MGLCSDSVLHIELTGRLVEEWFFNFCAALKADSLRINLASIAVNRIISNEVFHRTIKCSSIFIMRTHREKILVILILK